MRGRAPKIKKISCAPRRILRRFAPLSVCNTPRPPKGGQWRNLGKNRPKTEVKFSDFGLFFAFLRPSSEIPLLNFRVCIFLLFGFQIFLVLLISNFFDFFGTVLPPKGPLKILFFLFSTLLFPRTLLPKIGATCPFHPF